MRWISVIAVACSVLATNAYAGSSTQEPAKRNLATPVAHTGEPCKTIQTLKREHPTQHIFYETLSNSRKCYHVHTAKPQTEKDASEWVIPRGVNSFPRSRSNDVLEYFMQPHMRTFYDNYTRGSPFGR